MKTIKLKDRIEGKGEVKGIVFTKKFENDNGYVYEVSSKEYSYFEVFKKKVVNTCIDFKRKIFSDTEQKEIYPKSRDFGKWAWCVGSMEDAVSKIS